MDLPRVTASDKLLRDKGFNIDKYPKQVTYQSGLASMVYKLFDRNNSATWANKCKIKIKIKILLKVKLSQTMSQPKNHSKEYQKT